MMRRRELLTKPIKLEQKHFDDDRYLFAFCLCGLPINEYGLVFDLDKNKPEPDGFIYFKCTECKLHGSTYAGRNASMAMIQASIGGN